MRTKPRSSDVPSSHLAEACLAAGLGQNFAGPPQGSYVFHTHRSLVRMLGLLQTYAASSLRSCGRHTRAEGPCLDAHKLGTRLNPPEFPWMYTLLQVPPAFDRLTQRGASAPCRGAQSGWMPSKVRRGKKGKVGQTGQIVTF